ncbi:MAG: hypothetical protein JWP42_180 [Pseudomonas sp.]|nr:hypothetical protein [Pseudomonas sp.]
MDAVKVGKNFLTVNPTTVTQIVDPAANTNGVHLRTATLVSSTGTLNLWTGPTAPTGIGDRSKPAIFGGNGSAAGGANNQIQLPYPMFLPAGYGLWAHSNVAGAAISLTWDFLS